MIEIRDLSKIYLMGGHKVDALKNVSLTIERGDFVAVMGPSGSGKSTLTQILGLLDGPTSGSYKLNGREVSGLTEDELSVLRRDEIGFIFQQFNLIPNLTALENVILPSLMRKDTAAAVNASKKAESLLETVGLKDRMRHFPSELSGGEQQRVAIARSLMNDPKILFCDEPTGNLDIRIGLEIVEILRNFFMKEGKTVLVVTHDERIARMASRVWNIVDRNWRKN